MAVATGSVPARFAFKKEISMDLMIVLALLALVLTAYLIYLGYVARARGRKTPDQE